MTAALAKGTEALSSMGMGSTSTRAAARAPATAGQSTLYTPPDHSSRATPRAAALKASVPSRLFARLNPGGQGNRMWPYRVPTMPAAGSPTAT